MLLGYQVLFSSFLSGPNNTALNCLEDVRRTVYITGNMSENSPGFYTRRQSNMIKLAKSQSLQSPPEGPSH